MLGVCPQLYVPPFGLPTGSVVLLQRSILRATTVPTVQTSSVVLVRELLARGRHSSFDYMPVGHVHRLLRPAPSVGLSSTYSELCSGNAKVTGGLT